MGRGLFITGTDTGVGKTLVAASLISRLRSHGLRIAGMKPVASGSHPTPQGLRNEDALLLQATASTLHPYERVNPYAFEPPIAPHLAARAVHVAIDLNRLEHAYRELSAQADAVVVEGAGGWRVPLEPTGFLSDFPEHLQMEVILVVGLRLGCISHAVLTAEAISAGGRCRLAGWIGSCIDPAFEPLQANVDTLRHLLPAPCLGVIPVLSAASPAAALPYLEVEGLLGGTPDTPFETGE